MTQREKDLANEQHLKLALADIDRAGAVAYGRASEMGFDIEPERRASLAGVAWNTVGHNGGETVSPGDTDDFGLVPARDIAAFFDAEVGKAVATAAEHVVTLKDPAGSTTTVEETTFATLDRDVFATLYDEKWDGRLASNGVGYLADAAAKRGLAEFAQFYAAGRRRCPWAPENPRRAYNLALLRVSPRYAGRLSPEQFLAVMYDTLGYRGGKNRGLFDTFDPAKYRGERPLPDHFLSLFARKLTGLAELAVERTTDTGRPGDPGKFRPRSELALVRDRASSPWARRRLVDLPAALAFLDPRERAVVHLVYWSDLSARKTAALLGLDHKTVGRVHDQALRKLRRASGVEENLAN